MFSFTAYCFFMYFVSNGYTLGQEDVVASYEKAQVWRTKLRGDKDILTIKKLIDDQGYKLMYYVPKPRAENFYAFEVWNHYFISIWKLETNQADFLIKPDDKVKVNRILKSAKLNHSVIIMDVQRRVDSLKLEPTMWNEESLRLGHRLSFKEYPTLKIIDEYLVSITDSFPSICQLTTIGITSENRTIKMLKISNGNPENKVIMITAGSHAREWIGITSALYVLDKIVGRFDQLPRYMRTIDWMIIPVLNPDGYEYTHTYDRLWRKNRRRIKFCCGVDINRNFNLDWDVGGITNKDECYEGYSGPHPFSEAESLAIRDVIASSHKKPSAILDLHSYGQLILYPWCAKPSPTPDRRMLWTTSKAMTEAILNTTGTKYKFGATYHMIYPAPGATIDWMYASGASRAFAIELGDEGSHGFLLPPENIEPIGTEMLAAVRQLAREIDPELLRLRGLYDAWF